jgi:hypothetical protein
VIGEPSSSILWLKIWLSLRTAAGFTRTAVAACVVSAPRAKRFYTFV